VTTELRAHEDVGSFLEAATPLLVSDEARHNLIFGICSTILEAPDAYSAQFLWTVEADGDVAWAGVMTPPFNLVVAQPREQEALEFAARALYEQDVALPGVTGALPEADDFAGAWERLAGVRRRKRMAQGVYAIETPRLPPGVSGSFRFAGSSDRELVLQWLRDFTAEAMPPESPRLDMETIVDRRLASETAGFALWVDAGQVVSMSGFGGGTPNGVRIGPVYTPPPLRRRGYAGALVAELSRRLLAGGHTYCFLYTDLANPTSNRVYVQVGYELVCESAEYAFEAEEPARP
jgi:uncharacterized protein